MNPSHPLRRRIALVAGITIAMLGPPAGAATFTVDTTDPGTPADGMSFREAVAAANANTGVKDTIKFHNDIHNQVIKIDPGLGSIEGEEDLEIVGPGSDQLTISPVDGTATDNYVFFHVLLFGTAIEIEVSGLTVDGNRGNITNTGAAIATFSHPDSSLTLEDVIIQNVTDNGLSADTMQITITNSRFLENEKSGISISNSQNPVTITNTHVMDNGGNTGGIYLTQTGSAEIIDSTISGNETSGTGGGLHSNRTGQLTIRGSTIRDNVAGKGGGGINIIPADGSTLRIEDSTVSGNSTTDSDLTNDAELGSGGGLRVEDHTTNNYTLKIIQSTFSDNTAAGAGGGIFLGLRTAGSEIDIDHTTITNNSAEYSGGLLATTDSTTPNAADPGISHTVVAGNTGNVDGTDAGDSTGESGTGDDAVGDTINATYSFFDTVGANVNTDQFSTTNGGDPGLGELATPADGHQKTEVHLPETDSPLIDAGDPALTAGQGDTPASDQAGNTRIAGDAIDIGATESGPEENGSDDGSDGDDNDDGSGSSGGSDNDGGGGGGGAAGGLAGLLAALAALRRRRHDRPRDRAPAGC